MRGSGNESERRYRQGRYEIPFHVSAPVHAQWMLAVFEQVCRCRYVASKDRASLPRVRLRPGHRLLDSCKSLIALRGRAPAGDSNDC